MNKTVLGIGIALVIGIGAGVGITPYLSPVPASGEVANGDPVGQSSEKKPLFYRNPMNPAITSPVPAQDEMGMDYIPVYAEEPAKSSEPLFYRNPMNPAITSPVPAQDEMGMDYIPVYADDGGGSSSEPAGTVKIDPVVVQNIGVRTVQVERRDLTKTVRATGRITVDESRMARIHPRTEGWIEKQYAARTGDRVRKGDELLSLYSPQLVTSQQEYLLALDNLQALENSPYKDISDGARQLVESSRERLRLLDMPAHEIKALERRGQASKTVSIESPFNGVVLKIGAREGQYITPKTELYRLADLSKVWVLADVYDYELPWISVGDAASMAITGLEGRRFEGKVGYIYPFAQSKTRTVRVRLEFDNPDGLLKPDTFADVNIAADPRPDAIVVPSEAIVRSGLREQVFVVKGEGKFEPREVKLGYSSDGWVQVLEGLKPGERVVNSALFLIDSESKLREATAKMMEAMKEPGDDADMSLDGMEMDGLSMDELSLDEMSMDDLSMDAEQGALSND